jgi:hypothetical protein
LREFRYKNFRLTFGKKLEQLERRADKVGLPLPEKPKPPKQEAAAPSAGLGYLSYLPIGVPPGLVVLYAWQEIETALLEAATRHGIDRQRGSIKQIARQLEAAGVLPHEVVSIIDDLRVMRNRAAHGHESDLAVTPELAEEFRRLAERVVAAVKAANESRG